MILAALSPSIVDIFYKTPEHKLPRLLFADSISGEALLAFAEYMYNGVLNLDPDLLAQMKLIAMPLEMKALEQLCNDHLESLLPQNISSPSMEPMSSEPCSLFGCANETDNICDIDISLIKAEKVEPVDQQ